jgi:uncharacterized metal-binding protein YceD (DUF177 family)
VNPLRAFDIPFVGLKSGVHHFNYEIDNSFFQNFKESLVTNCKARIDLSLDKEESFFLLDFQIDGTVNVICDRCGELFDISIENEQRLLVKFGEITDENEGDDDVIFISRNETLLNVAQLIYEFINLSVPLHKVHPDKKGKSTCNKEVIKKLDELSPAHREAELNTTWSQLKKIKIK